MEYNAAAILHREDNKMEGMSLTYHTLVTIVFKNVKISAFVVVYSHGTLKNDIILRFKILRKQSSDIFILFQKD